MNRKQKVCLWIGIIIIVLMGLYPPWVRHHMEEFSYGRYSLTTKPGPYSFIWNLPWGAKFINVYRLGVQWAMVAAVTGGFIITFANKKHKKPKDEQNNK